MFRWPSADRSARAALPAEERVFWAIILSLTMSCMLTLAFAVAGVYTFGRLVGTVLGLSLLLAASARGDLRLGPSAARVQPSALVPTSDRPPAAAFAELVAWAARSDPPCAADGDEPHRAHRSPV